MRTIGNRRRSAASASRARVVAFSFTSNWSRAHILHSEGIERSRELLRRTFAALAPGGTVAS
jgi:hypothetical protein